MLEIQHTGPVSTLGHVESTSKVQFLGDAFLINSVVQENTVGKLLHPYL